jgi:hypothetical protein
VIHPLARSALSQTQRAGRAAATGANEIHVAGVRVRDAAYAHSLLSCWTSCLIASPDRPAITVEQTGAEHLTLGSDCPLGTRPKRPLYMLKPLAVFLGAICHRSSADCVSGRNASCRPNF